MAPRRESKWMQQSTALDILIFILIDGCISQPSLEKLLSQVDGNSYRDPKLVIIEKTSDCGQLSPKWEIYSTSPPTMVERSSQKREQKTVRAKAGRHLQWSGICWT